MHLCMNAFTFTGKNAKAHTDLQTLQNNANSILKSSLLIFLRCFNVTFIFHLVLLLDIFAFNLTADLVEIVNLVEPESWTISDVN